MALKKEPGNEMEKYKMVETLNSDVENVVDQTHQRPDLILQEEAMSSRTCTPKERKEEWQRG